MNRVVISVPRVLDSAVTYHHEQQCAIATGNLPVAATAPFNVTRVKPTPTETQLQNLTVTPLNDHTNCCRVTGEVTIPITLTIDDANHATYDTYSNLVRQIDIVLYIPNDAVFPYTITSEGTFSCCGCTCDKTTTTLRNVNCEILTRVTAVTDLLIPTYGYAPINLAENYQSPTSVTNQPLFPVGKVY